MKYLKFFLICVLQGGIAFGLSSCSPPTKNQIAADSGLRESSTPPWIGRVAQSCA